MQSKSNLFLIHSYLEKSSLSLLSCRATNQATCFLYRSTEATKHKLVNVVSQTETSAVPKKRRVIRVGEKEVPEDVLSYVKQQALSALASCLAQDPTRRDPPQPS